MLAGYVRVSTLDQNPELQLDALSAAGYEKIFEDRASGAQSDRPGLAEVLGGWLRKGDTLVIWRLGRSLSLLVATVRELEEKRFGFRSLTEGHDLVRERTMAGLAAARARGRTGGQPSKLTPQLRR